MQVADRGHNPYGTSRNSSAVAFAWRDQLPYSNISFIQSQCSEAMEKLGYKLMRSQDDKESLRWPLEKSPREVWPFWCRIRIEINVIRSLFKQNVKGVWFKLSNLIWYNLAFKIQLILTVFWFPKYWQLALLQWQARTSSAQIWLQGAEIEIIVEMCLIAQ